MKEVAKKVYNLMCQRIKENLESLQGNLELDLELMDHFKPHPSPTGVAYIGVQEPLHPNPNVDLTPMSLSLVQGSDYLNLKHFKNQDGYTVFDFDLFSIGVKQEGDSTWILLRDK